MFIPTQIPFALFTLDEKVVVEPFGVSFMVVLNEVQKQHIGGVTSADFICKSSVRRL
jgi:hypothetical protein